MHGLMLRASGWLGAHKLLLWTIVFYLLILLAALWWADPANGPPPTQVFPGND